MEIKVSGRKVTVVFELQDARPSSTGKSNIVYTTGGYVPVPGTDMKINLTMITPRNNK